jgi:hypothetical protein
MPYFLLSLLVQMLLIVHVIKTGRNTIWIWVLALLPGAGTLAYVIVEILPELFGSRFARSTARGMRRAIDPNRELRDASARAAVTDSVEAKRALGAELVRRGEYATAVQTYRSGLRGLYEFDPTLLLGLAEAQFASGDPSGARLSLDDLIAHNPEFKSPDGHLLYARALEAEGNHDKAEAEYRAVAGYYPGAEAKVRLAQFLKRAGKATEAAAVLDDVLRTAQLAPRHVRRAQAEWIALARQERAGG